MSLSSEPHAMHPGLWQIIKAALWVPGRREVLVIILVISLIAVAEAIFVYAHPAWGAMVALALVLSMIGATVFLPLPPSLGTCLEAMSLIPLYILLTASLPWFFFDTQLLLPAVYSMVLGLCLWYLDRRHAPIMQLIGLDGISLWKTLKSLGLVAVPGILLGAMEYIILTPPPSSPFFSPEIFMRDAFYMFCFVALGEELLFRGIIQGELTEIIGWPTALMLSSVLFTVMHLTWRSVPELFFVLIAGGLMGYLYTRTGNLRASILLHGINNTTLIGVVPYLLRSA